MEKSRVLDSYIKGDKCITIYGYKDGQNTVITRKRVTTVNDGDSLTQQNTRDQTDVNLIMARHHKGEAITHYSAKQMVYADLANIPDYPDALQKIIQAQNAFSELNAETRNFFANDPNRFIEFLKDEKNIDKGVELGIYVPKKIEVQENKIENANNDETKNLKTNTTKNAKIQKSTDTE